MITKVISGGQLGVDQAALSVARRFSVPTGGYAPRGWLTETGPAPWLADYGLAECDSPDYPVRTRLNVKDSDATLWFGRTDSRGFASTRSACLAYGVPFKVMSPGILPSQVADWLIGVQTVNIAGNRESGNPGIGERAEAFLCEVFRGLGFKEKTT